MLDYDIMLKMNNALRPAWLKKKIEVDGKRSTSSLLNSLGVNTVCKEAKCPNMVECFKKGHATFLILGRSCTRRCRFCNVEKSAPGPLDSDEPEKVAQAVRSLGLKHVVITSVTRDDLPDGGASQFMETVSEIRKLPKPTHIELLIPDFKGEPEIVRSIAKSRPDIIGHNVETVPRLYDLRPEADYKISLSVLKLLKEENKNIYTKSSLMLGLGETEDEIIEVIGDLRKAGCDFLALGQYLRPSEKNVEVREYIAPKKFKDYRSYALSLGFRHIESAPFARTSYRAENYLLKCG